MRPWLPLRPTRRSKRRSRSGFIKAYSSKIEQLHITCASSGSISLSLVNVKQHDFTRPLILYMPPFPSHGPAIKDKTTVLPSWLSSFPVAVINYRWSNGSLPPIANLAYTIDEFPKCGTPGISRRHIWPVPLHDTLFAYTWLTEKLGSSGKNVRRDIYVVGSYLGATLGTSLALTESHSSLNVSVRGLIAYNGLYDWTTFLPHHPANKMVRRRGEPGARSDCRDEDQDSRSLFRYLQTRMPQLFGHNPANLFDPFASPCLLFQSPALHPSAVFDELSSLPSSVTSSKAVDRLSDVCLSEDSPNPDEDAEKPSARPVYLAFPPPKSTLRIPETLLLHESDSLSFTQRCSVSGTSKLRKDRPGEGRFAFQARKLARLMRRSIVKWEMKTGWQADLAMESEEAREQEAAQRVQVAGVGKARGKGGDHILEMGRASDSMVEEWLSKRMERSAMAAYDA